MRRVVNGIRIHPVHWQSTRAIVIEEPPMPRPPDRATPQRHIIDLSALAEELATMAGKLDRARHQIHSVAMAEDAALRAADNTAEIEALTKQLDHQTQQARDSGATLALVRDEIHKWSTEDQPSNLTVRAIAEALNL